MKESFEERCLDAALFAGINSEEINGLLMCINAHTKDAAKGEMILSEGEPAESLGIVLEGAVQIVREDYDGSRSIIAHIEAGGMFAETFACAGIARMPVSVVMSQNGKVLLIKARRVLQPCSHCCAHHNLLMMNLMKILAGKNLLSNQKMEILSQKTTREKLLTYLRIEAKNKASAAFAIPFDRQELADYLGVDRSGLSTEIGKLQKEGVLRCDRKNFELL